MSTLLSKTIAACGLALAATTLCASPSAFASERKHPLARDTAKAKAKPAAAAVPDEPEPDIRDTTVTDYNCELGNKITIYHNDNDNSHIALRWKKRLHRLTRVGTTTGANRFENSVFGLIWIGIPSKGMLLDSKLNHQLANECKTVEQAKPLVVEAQNAKKS
jgi:membrane-bound inhibitor of C-type lysozyme